MCFITKVYVKIKMALFFFLRGNRTIPSKWPSRRYQVTKDVYFDFFDLLMREGMEYSSIWERGCCHADSEIFSLSLREAPATMRFWKGLLKSLDSLN